MPSSEYDLVVMWEVIEHVFNVKGYLDEIYQALKPGGIFLFSTPNYFRSTYQKEYFGALSSPPVHINFFTKNSLQTVLNEAGFKKSKVFKRKLYFPSNRSWDEIKVVCKRLFAIEESPTLIGIAKKTRY